MEKARVGRQEKKQLWRGVNNLILHMVITERNLA